MKRHFFFKFNFKLIWKYFSNREKQSTGGLFVLFLKNESNSCESLFDFLQIENIYKLKNI